MPPSSRGVQARSRSGGGRNVDRQGVRGSADTRTSSSCASTSVSSKGPTARGSSFAVSSSTKSVVLLGSAKMFDDNIIAASQNALLLLNAVENLSGNSDLMSIRASASYFRPFTRVDEMRISS